MNFIWKVKKMTTGNNIRVIQSIQRAIDIINCFTEFETSLSINEISKKLSLHVNTTRGIINTLVYNGYLIHDPIDNKYSLGFIFIPKAELVSLHSVENIKEIVHPYLVKIANRHQVSARLQLVSQYDNIFTVDTVNPESSRYILLTRLDTKFPLNATSSGKLYLYYSSEKKRQRYLESLNESNHIRYTEKTILDRRELEKELEFIDKNGYSFEDEEVSLGISSIAVPLFNKNNKFIGTISITAMNAIIEKVYDEVLNDMRCASEDIRKKFIITYNI